MTQIDSTPGIVHTFNRLKTRLPLDRAEMLDLFGGTGMNVTVHIAHYVGSITAWDKDEQKLSEYKYQFPMARTKCCDVYDELRKIPSYPRFNIILVDNFLLDKEHPEHFDIFPWIYSHLRSPGYLILQVCRKIRWYAHELRLSEIEKRTGMKPKEYMPVVHEARKKFYGSPKKDGSYTDARMETQYGMEARKANRKVTWTHWQERIVKTDLWWFTQETQNENQDRR